MTSLYTINAINFLPDAQKSKIYRDLIPKELLERFGIPRSCVDPQGRDLMQAKCTPGIPSVELSLFHHVDFSDPILYGHLADTANGQIHVLLYVMNDPDAPRFDVDKMPDGRPTKFGTLQRNIDAEQAAFAAGLAPGQIRRGLRLLSPAISAFETFIVALGHDLYFVEPLYYHSAAIFERYGFAYQQGRKLMQRIQTGFSPGGDLLKRLDGSAFRRKGAEDSIRLRSWAIHDGLLGEPFTNVTMYKRVGKNAGISTTADTKW